MKKENSISRRSFLKSSALAGALGAIGTGSTVGVLTSCGGGESANAIKPLKEPGTYYVPELPDLATDGKELKAGVIGCGGRGSGAAFNFLNAANGVTIVALGDTFQERVDDLAKKLKDEKGIDVPADKRFVGLDAYKQVIEKYPGSEEARLAMRDLKSIYVDLNRIDEFAALANAMPGHIRFDANEQDSLTYTAAEKIYMKGRMEEAKTSLNKYLQTFPEGAFSLNAHYYLCLIGSEQSDYNSCGSEQKNYDMILLHSGKLLEYPNNPFAEEALILRAEVQFNQQNTAEALASYKMLKEKATNVERRQLAETGILRCAFLLRDDVETIHAATDLLVEPKLSPELRNEALYYRAKAYTNQKAGKKAMDDYRELAKDTRNSYGAEAKYQVAQGLYDAKEYAAAEKELLNYIEQSTPHAYWLARSFVLLSDVYHATGKDLDARQYLLSLQQNYQGNDDIESMIESRLQKLKTEN